MKEGVDVRDATHVKVGGQFKKIAAKWGIDSEGRLSKPSEGGFGVVTEDGQKIDMWQATLYGKE